MILSIITISYNQFRFLPQAVSSVFSQLTRQVEYILVDACSTDGSAEWLRANHNFFSTLIIEPDDGPANGLNKALNLAKGEFVFFLNADDFLLQGSIGMILCNVMEAPSAISLAGAEMVDEKGAHLRFLKPYRLGRPDIVTGVYPIVQQGMTLPLKEVLIAGGFNEQNKTCWDLELLCDLLVRGLDISYSQEAIAAFRYHGGSFTGGKGGMAHERSYRRDLNRIRKKYRSFSRRTAENSFQLINRFHRYSNISHALPFL